MLDRRGWTNAGRAATSGRQVWRWLYRHAPTDAALAFRDVWFRHDQRPALQGISIRLSRCARIALVGLSGAGKSTVIASSNGSTTSPDWPSFPAAWERFPLGRENRAVSIGPTSGRRRQRGGARVSDHEIGVLAIGAGPANLALAAAVEESGSREPAGETLLPEQSPDIKWQRNLLMPWARSQSSPP